jgi:hypothetical protein
VSSAETVRRRAAQAVDLAVDGELLERASRGPRPFRPEAELASRLSERGGLVAIEAEAELDHLPFPAPEAARLRAATSPAISSRSRSASALSIAPLLAKTIERIFGDRSVSTPFAGHEAF